MAFVNLKQEKEMHSDTNEENYICFMDEFSMDSLKTNEEQGRP
jgi:hypothetical protein